MSNEAKDKVLCFEDHMGSLQVTRTDQGLSFCAANDWCGDTETGFGADCDFTISTKEAGELYRFLRGYLDDMGS